jgi:hypothetical protein
MAISSWSTTAASNTSVDGVNIGEGCDPGNVNDAMRNIMADVAVAIGTYTFNLTNTGDIPLLVTKTATGNSGGASDLRAMLYKLTYNGAYGTTNEITGAEFQNEFCHTAGTITFGYGLHGYTAMGTGSTGQPTGAITSMRGIEWHTANKSSNAQPIAAATNFFSGDMDISRSGVTGTIGSMTGFFCGDQGHASRVTVSAIGFDCGNMTAGSPKTAAFRSQMANGTNTWAFLGEGNAPSALTGALRIGDNTRPTDALEVKGVAKITTTGTITASGAYHELVSGNNDYVAHARNTHASAPQGFRIRFTAASPNNRTQSFLLCEDSTTTRMQVFSDGTVYCQAVVLPEMTSASVPTPAAGTQALFIDSSDHKLKRKDSSNTVTVIA